MADGERSANVRPSSSNSSIKSAKGDWRAVKLLVDMLHETEGGSEPEAAESSFGEADQKVIEQLKARLNGKKRESDD